MSTLWSFKIVYENGDIYTSLDGLPKDAPNWGVLAIAQPNVDYRDILWNEYVYIYRTDRGFWTGHDRGGLIDQLVHFAHLIEAVRFGRDTLDSTMHKIVTSLAIEMRGK